MNAIRANPFTATRTTGFKKSFIVSCIVHALAIGAVVVGEAFTLFRHEKPPNIVFIPAAIKGEPPRGNGIGAGVAPVGNSPRPSENPQSGSKQNTPPPPRPTAPPPSTASTPSVATRPPSSNISAPPRRPPTTNAATVRPPTRPTTAPSQQAAKNSSRPPASSGAAATPSSQNQYREQLLAAVQRNGGGGGQAGIPDGGARPTGTGAAGTPAGGGTGQGRLGARDGADNGNFGGIGKGSPFWEYRQHIQDTMYLSWQLPSQYADALRPPTALMRLRIGKDGSLWEAKLVESSGIAGVDDSVRDAAREARLSPPPVAMLNGKDFVELTVEFMWKK